MIQLDLLQHGSGDRVGGTFSDSCYLILNCIQLLVNFNIKALDPVQEI